MAMPNIRINYRVPFPARVQGVSGLSVLKANGTYSITLDYSGLVDIFPVPADLTSCTVAYFNAHSGEFAKLTLQEFGVLAAGAAATIHIVASGASYAATPSDGIIVLNKAIAGATTITLPDVNNRSPLGLPLEIYDFAGTGGDITITPFGAQLIMGANASYKVASGGVAQTGGAIRLIPNVDLNGWVVK